MTGSVLKSNVAVSHPYPLSGQRPFNPASAAQNSSKSPVTMTVLNDWFQKCTSALPRSQKIEKNGVYPLLKKEIDNITNLFQEGQAIAQSSHCVISEFVDILVKPYLTKLQNQSMSLQRALAENEKNKDADIKIADKWESLGLSNWLPDSVLESHADCVRFLFESGLIFSIAGYRETSGNAEMKLDPVDGHPLIKVEGEYKRWENIKQHLVYDPQTYQIRTKDYPGSIVESWSYLSPDGLVRKDRLNNEKLEPIYRLNETEHKRIKDFALKFYETNPEVDPTIPKDWVLQFHTSPRRKFVTAMPDLPKDPLYDNLVRNLNTHIVIRLIAPNGDVYSAGVEMPAESQEFLYDFTNFLGTVTAKVNKTGDFEEFRPHSGRLVTSMPLSDQRADTIMNLLNNLGDVRFNFMRQNCSNLAQMTLKEAGYDIDLMTTAPALLYDALPDVKHIHYIGPVLEVINQLFRKIAAGICYITPQPIQNIVSIGADILLYVPRKIRTVALNLLFLKLGAGKMLHPLPNNTPEDELYNANRYLNFSRLIRSWGDIFDDKIGEIYHSKGFIKWQKEQNSTFTDPYTGSPKLSIVPPVA